MKAEAITTVVLLALTVAILLSGCVEQPQGEEEKFVIGALLPLTGEVGDWGQNVRKGIDLAVLETNESGGIDGKMLEVVYEDSQCNPGLASSGMQKLVSIDKVPTVIGEICSSATLAAAPIAEQNQVVLVSPGSAADSISEAGDFVFRNYLTNQQIVEGVFGLLEKADKIAILYVNNDYGIGLKQIIEDEFDGKVVSADAHDQKETDFRSTLLKVKEKSPGTVFLATYYTDGALIMKQAKEIGLETQFVSEDSVDDPKLIEIAGNAAEGLVFSTVKPGAGPAFAEFSSRYKKNYNSEPPFLADFGYDTVNLIIKAMKNGNYSGKEIRDYLYSINNYAGASNTITFDRNGDLTEPVLVLKTVKNGEFVLYEGE